MVPRGIQKIVEYVKELYDKPAIIVTENGKISNLHIYIYIYHFSEPCIFYIYVFLFSNTDPINAA